MLSSSLRRAVWVPIAPVTGACRTSSQGLATASTGIVRQRRYSSSSSKPVDASSQAPTKEVSSGAKRAGKTSRRNGKDGSGNGRNGSKSSQPNAFSNLPSVPSTQHLQPHDVQLASFFSIHRPISVSTTVPPPSSPEAFDSIFTKQASQDNAEDVIFTLSSAVNTMENVAHHLAEADGPMTASEVESNQLDSMDFSELKRSVEEMTKRLRPFNPPPPPTPYVAAAEGEQQQGQETSSYSTVLTIHESTHSDGSKTYEAHTTPFVQARSMEAPGADEAEAEAIIDAPQNSQTNYIERVRNNNETMQALSTRRRRVRKMKNHKFKKLLRRTRTLRRKLDKA
ncbi:mitochondrial 37S ribosomal protein mS38 [Aspergillus undulatus]|uniref:mitochondrial 37S ribosomal protein mS38 n=1 Tax=Aspergillus undulatus TaxID=1810928 RepID=UPI003CCD5561